MEIELGNNITPSIIFSLKAKQKMDMYVKFANKEVGWYGLVERHDDFNFYVRDVYMLNQEVNSATTEIDPQALGTLKFELMKNKTITIENQLTTGLYLWGHSHVDMEPTPSGQDVSQFKTICSKDQPPYFIRLIMNKAGKYTIALFINNIPFFGSVVFKNMEVLYEVDPELKLLEESVKAEMNTKVKDKVSTTVYSSKAYTGSSIYERTCSILDYEDDYDVPVYLSSKKTSKKMYTPKKKAKTIGKVTRKKDDDFDDYDLLKITRTDDDGVPVPYIKGR